MATILRNYAGLSVFSIPSFASEYFRIHLLILDHTVAFIDIIGFPSSLCRIESNSVLSNLHCPETIFLRSEVCQDNCLIFICLCHGHGLRRLFTLACVSLVALFDTLKLSACSAILKILALSILCIACACREALLLLFQIYRSLIETYFREAV
jgi:hypothetical protein